MLFDVAPKETEKDFFNYEKELNSFVNTIKDERSKIVIIKGLRRTGKSSLLRVGLKLSAKPYILIDPRELTAISRKAFEAKFIDKLYAKKFLHEKILDRIKSIEYGVHIDLKAKEDIWDILKNKSIVIAVDEVQMLNGTGVDAFFAAIYDNTPCKIVFTGSEVGVLDRFIGKDNPRAPLFGRAYTEIMMTPLSEEKAMEFLKKGFMENGISIEESMLRMAVERLDGIIGWLTLFGYEALKKEPEDALDDVIQKGSKLAFSEFEGFLERRYQAKERYLAIVEGLSLRPMKWSEIKDFLFVKLKEKIADNQISNYLNNLVEYGFVTERKGYYTIPDPLLKTAISLK